MLSGKVAIITGSSQGIGAATAIYFTQEGASVTITGRDIEKLNNVAKKCEEVGKKPLVVAGDISEESFPKTLLDKTIEKFKKLDVLVNNAGVGGRGGLQDVSISMEQYDRIFKLNLKAVYRLTKLALPYLVETKGNVVNISSITGIRPFANLLDYCMSKAALEQFTRCLALEMASKNVRVNVLGPGPVYTDFVKNYGRTDEQTKEMRDYFNATVPMKRIATAEEIARPIAFLASDAASYITGVSLPVDAGLQLV